MARETKADLQKKIEELRQMLADAEDKYYELVKAKDDDFSKSLLYKTMQKDMEFYKAGFRISEIAVTSKLTKAEKKLQAARQIYDDNKALCASHGAEYWIGLSRCYESDYSQIKALQEQLNRAKAENQVKDMEIQHLLSILGFDPESKPAGRKKHNEKWTVQRQQFRELIESGSKPKEIREKLGISEATYYRMKKENSETDQSLPEDRRLIYPDNWDDLCDRYQEGSISISEFMQSSGVGKGVFYNLLKQYRQQHPDFKK